MYKFFIHIWNLHILFCVSISTLKHKHTKPAPIALPLRQSCHSRDTFHKSEYTLELIFHKISIPPQPYQSILLPHKTTYANSAAIRYIYTIRWLYMVRWWWPITWSFSLCCSLFSKRARVAQIRHINLLIFELLCMLTPGPI